MEEDKKEQNTESVEKEKTARGGVEIQKQENTKTIEQSKSAETAENAKENEKKETENTEVQATKKENDKKPKNSDANTETKEEEQPKDEDKDSDSSEQKEEKLKNEKKEDKSKIIFPNVIPGANVKIHQKIKEKKGKEEKERIQIFEGIVLERKGGSSAGANVSVKKICKGGFEVKKIYPLHSPLIAKIEVVRQAKVRQAKLGFLTGGYKKKLKYGSMKAQKQ